MASKALLVTRCGCTKEVELDPTLPVPPVYAVYIYGGPTGVGKRVFESYARDSEGRYVYREILPDSR